jgi:GTP-binding protein
VILEDDKETVVADMTREGMTATLATGGDGGRGNASFKTSTNQAPRQAEEGFPGEERWLWLRLKLIADAGLVGLPNAGKSTFLSVVSHAKPKIADYPFTTLTPQLGVAQAGDGEIVIADIPGLIEGAHEGTGLGDRFLGHVERCGALLHLVDIGARDPVADWRTVRAELDAYGHGLGEKQEIVALSKCDLGDEEIVAAIRAELLAAGAERVLALSSATGAGVKEALHTVADAVAESRAEVEPEPWTP